MKRAFIPVIVAGTSLLAGLISAAALAQPVIRQPTPLPAFGRDPVGNHDTTASITNPALLGFLSHAELRWSSAYLDEDAKLPWQGHAIAFGFPIPLLNLGTALRWDIMSPPSAALLPNYQFLTWATGIRLSDTSALGFSWQRSYSDSRLMHALSSWSLGWTIRPFNAIGLSVAGRSLNAPENNGGGRLDPTWDFGLSIRPLGTDVIEVGMAAAYALPSHGPETMSPRGSLGVRIPGFGRLRGDVLIGDVDERAGERAWMATASMVVDVNDVPTGSAEYALGTMAGSGLGKEAKWHAASNLTMDVAFRGFREPTGAEVPHVGLRIRITETPGVREHVRLLRRLWSVAESEPGVEVVVLEITASPAEGMARTQELRDAVSYLRQHGKTVVCHMQDASGNTLYLCSQANQVLIHPAGMTRFAGFSTTQLYFKGLLDKLGVRADFVRIGDHKSAPEQFTRQGPTEVAEADRLRLMKDIERQWLTGVAKGRLMTSEEVARKIAVGPMVSSEAKQAKLVDRIVYTDEIGDQLRQLVGHSVPLVDEIAPRHPDTFGAARKVAVVYIDGDMTDGKSQTIPFFGIRMSGAETLAKTFRELRDDPSVGAVVLRIESPGGSVMAADSLWREIQLLEDKKPVAVSMGAVAASGGYYIASAAGRIFANPGTVTGSIGIFYGKADIAQLLERVGISADTVKTTPHADAESVFRPYTDEERQGLMKKITQFYEMFLARVSLGRHLSRDEVDKVGQGKVFTGSEALAAHLVDELGGMREALAWARAAAHLPEHAVVAEYPALETTIVGRLLGIEGVRVDAQVLPLPPQVTRLARQVGPMLVYDGDRPLARLEWNSDLP